MSTISTNLKHIRLLTGLNQKEFAQEVGVAQSTLSLMERGDREVSEKVSHTIEFRFRPRLDYLHEPIKYYSRGSLHFRHAREGRAHIDQVTTAFSISEHYLRKEYTGVQSILPELPIPDRNKPLSLEALEELAQNTRQFFGLDSGSFIRNLTELLHQHKVLVTELPGYITQESNCDGVSSPDDKGVRVIALNRNRSGDRYRFSLAHELAHLVLHTSTPRTDRAALEEEANKFAAAFLMPRELLVGKIDETMTLLDYLELKQQWGYSLQAIIRRAHELKLLSYDRYRSLRMQISGRGWRITEPGNVLLENLHVAPITILHSNDRQPEQTDSMATVIDLHGTTEKDSH